MNVESDREQSKGTPRDDSKSGRRTVLAMFGFGAAMVLALWVYWEAYTRPFRPLQYAIAKAFPGSSPRVIGGRYKSHKPDAANTLRVVARVPLAEFDLSVETGLAEARALKLAELVLHTQDLADYRILEIRLIQRVPEQETRQWFVEHSPAEWEALLTSLSTPPAPEASPLPDK